ncbi:hypothetical protein GCM10022198_19210 [Klugiella xanthotipulae]|uniref:Single-stranded DNA-binding protein n=1 Tax=Klugiella xanthotipulae TaxID=244735 RepID=A0A543HS04_9MICO|nr:single-stranded DNA-binding protein [Klugiella xanthotipulae]TQM61121.1 single-stranded DNA-binding protein [Klugiella xanthotipulae]
MAITTKLSLSGFIASDPQLTFTGSGDARFYARVGQEHFSRSEDGVFTPLDPTFTDLVVFRKAAERAYTQFQKGDRFIAEGDVRSYAQKIDGEDVQREQFVAARVGHDGNRTTYTVDRTPRGRETERESATKEPVGTDLVQAALEQRETTLETEPTPAGVATDSRPQIAR